MKTETETKETITDKLGMTKRPNTKHLMVLLAFALMFTLNLSGIFLDDKYQLIIQGIAYIIAFALAGITAGNTLAEYVRNRRWNKMIAEAVPIPEDSPLNDIFDFMDGKTVDSINGGLPKTQKAPPMPRAKPPKRSNKPSTSNEDDKE